MALHYFELESFHMPSQKIWLLLIIGSIFNNVLFDYLFIRITILLGPMVANTAQCLAFPVSLLVEIFAFDKKFSWFYLLGSACVFTSFAVIMYNQHQPIGEKMLKGTDRSDNVTQKIPNETEKQSEEDIE